MESLQPALEMSHSVNPVTDATCIADVFPQRHHEGPSLKGFDTCLTSTVLSHEAYEGSKLVEVKVMRAPS